MKSLLGKQVVIKELSYKCAARDGQPSEIGWGGVITEVENHMVLLEVQMYRDPSGYDQPRRGQRWFNTNASTFVAIEA